MRTYNDWFASALNTAWGLVLEHEVIKWLPFPLKRSIVLIVVIESMDLPPRTNYVVHGLKPSRVSMLLNNNVCTCGLLSFVARQRELCSCFLNPNIIVPVCLFITESISKNCARSRSWRCWIGQEGHFWVEVGHSLTFSIRLFVWMHAWAN